MVMAYDWTSLLGEIDSFQVRRTNSLLDEEDERRRRAGMVRMAVIAEALSRDMPVLVGVNGLNMLPFLDFSGGMAQRLAPDRKSVLDWCLAACRAGAGGVCVT